MNSLHSAGVQNTLKIFKKKELTEIGNNLLFISDRKIFFKDWHIFSSLWILYRSKNRLFMLINHTG